MTAAENESAAPSGLSEFKAEWRYESLVRYYCSRELARQYPSDLPLDLWRLVHEQIRAESNFDPNAVSPAGAVGLLQIMPETAIELGVRDRTNPEHAIRGGVEYLIRHCWMTFKVERGMERLRFGIASYNCGTGNIIRAQRLANERGLPTSIWSSIARMLPDVTHARAAETINYVAKIMAGYEGKVS